ncbi:MAG: zinc ribbon domain-containing protein [Candidatus Dojkabacteria bacterium]|nr:zinc ribbon domain-containing protein [Candidatus Dojkabacteria bacterium]
MKRFCSQCGKELEKNILICPKCGYKNKKSKNKKRFVLPIIIFIILITLGGLSYIFRNQIIGTIGNPLDFIARIQDPDYETKENFKETYEKYLLEISYYTSTMGYPLNKDNANDYETVGYKVNGSTNLTTLELYNQAESTWNELEEKSCFKEFNVDSDCDKLREKLDEVYNEIWLKVYNKQEEYRFCGSDKFEHFVQTCEAALEWEYTYSYNQCKTCGERIQQLLTIASSISDPGLGESLIKLTAYLKEYNELTLLRLTAQRDFNDAHRIASQYKHYLYLLENMTESEAKAEFSKEEYSLTLSLNGIEGSSITKRNLTKLFEEYAWGTNRVSETADILGEYSEAREIIIDEMTSLVSIINGSYGLNLSN